MNGLRVTWIIGAVSILVTGCGSDGGNDTGLPDAGDQGMVDAPSDSFPDPGTSDPGQTDLAPPSDPGTDDAIADVPMPFCCQDDDECPGDKLCIGGEFESGGICLPEPSGDDCFSQKDCPAKHFCWGATICSCDMNCISEPGTCLHLPGGCCKGDDQCEAGMKCAHDSDLEMGVCEVLPPTGKCWDPEDCPAGQACVGSHVCPCDADCALPDLMGECTDLPAGCCNTTEDCDGGFVCKGASPFGGLPGSCVADPDGPQCPGDFACCWDDDDCTGESTCQGAYYCGCIALCPNCGDCAEFQMGACS